MTTQKQPADQSAATDQADQVSPAEHQASPAEPVASEAAAADSAFESAASPSSDAPSVAERASDAAAEDAADAGAAASGESADTQAASQVSSADTDSHETAGAPAPPQRRVRLNPTVAPEVARPIPSLRPSEPPPPPPAPAAPARPQPPVEQPATAAAGQATPPEVITPPAPPSDEDHAAPEQQPPSQPAETATAAAPPRPSEPVELPGRHEALDADLEAELEAALAAGEQPSAAVVEPPAPTAEGDEQPSPTAAAAVTPDMEIKQGVKLTGTVASIHGDDMFLDFGLRMPGVLSRRQFGLRKQPMQGESLEVVVGRIDESEGLIHVNLPTGTSRVRGEWDALSVDQNVECMVTGTNKGGLEVSIGALRGFMPASQVELGFVPDLNVYIGQRLKARITEVNPKRRKLVLSRRSLLEEEREESQRELFGKIEPGQQYTGRVRTLKDYGAFVDIGGADGLLHVAQISWSRINHPSEVLREGEEIQVQVLSVDRDKKKISLGMRQLTQNPWKAAESKFAQGSQVKGKVTRIENFGAFVELDEGVEGLVHISELDHKRVNKVSEVLRVGQEVDVQVLEVDPKRKRVSLSLKALKEKPEDAQDRAEAAPIKRQRSVDSLVGGIGEPTGGQLFGDPSKFGR